MKKIKIIIYICACVIIINIVAKFFIIGNQSNQIFILQQKIMAIRSDSSTAFKKSEQQISKQHNDINMIMDEIPKVLSFSKYAVKIRSLIDENKLFIEGSLVFSPGKAKNSSLLVYSTGIKVTGKYQDIKQFIADVQNLKGLKHLNAVSMIRGKKDRTKVILGFKLSVFLRNGTV